MNLLQEKPPNQPRSQGSMIHSFQLMGAVMGLAFLVSLFFRGPYKRYEHEQKLTAGRSETGTLLPEKTINW
jgi:hypothetical protein